MALQITNLEAEIKKQKTQDKMLQNGEECKATEYLKSVRKDL